MQNVRIKLHLLFFFPFELTYCLFPCPAQVLPNFKLIFPIFFWLSYLDLNFHSNTKFTHYNYVMTWENRYKLIVKVYNVMIFKNLDENIYKWICVEMSRWEDTVWGTTVSCVLLETIVCLWQNTKLRGTNFTSPHFVVLCLLFFERI